MMTAHAMVWMGLALAIGGGCKSKPSTEAGTTGSAAAPADSAAPVGSAAGSTGSAGSAGSADSAAADPFGGSATARAVFGPNTNPVVIGPGGLVSYALVRSEATGGTEDFSVKRLCGESAAALLTKAWTQIHTDALRPDAPNPIECTAVGDLTRCGQPPIGDVGYRIDVKKVGETWTAVGVRATVAGLNGTAMEAIVEKLGGEYEAALKLATTKPCT